MNKKICSTIVILFWAALAALTVTVVFKVTNLSMPKMIFVIVIVLAGFLIQIYRIRKNAAEENNLKKYFSKLTGHSENRVNQYDWLRVFAAAMVIMTHAISAQIEGEEFPDSTLKIVFTIACSVCLLCNLIYVMLSGALLVEFKKESLLDFYLRRLPRILLPMIVYYVVTSVVFYKEDLFCRQGILSIITNLYSGNLPEAPHFWLMYVILGVYFVVPILRAAFANMSYKALSGIAGLTFALITLTKIFPTNALNDFTLATWIGIAIIGFWVARKETRRLDPVLMIIGAAGFVILCILVVTGNDYSRYCINCSPVSVMMACGLFALVFKAGIFSRGNIVISFISKYSYSIMLIHWVILYFIAKWEMGLSITQFGNLGVFVILAVTMGIGIVYAFVIDNLILVVIETLYDLIIFKPIKALTSKKQ